MNVVGLVVCLATLTHLSLTASQYLLPPLVGGYDSPYICPYLSHYLSYKYITKNQKTIEKEAKKERIRGREQMEQIEQMFQKYRRGHSPRKSFIFTPQNAFHRFHPFQKICSTFLTLQSAFRTDNR